MIGAEYLFLPNYIKLIHKVMMTPQNKSDTQHPLLDDPDFPVAALAKSYILKGVLLFTRL